MSEFWTTATYEPLAIRPKTKHYPVHEGKTFIVTGAGGGIGRQIVAVLAAEGANVAAWDLRHDALVQVAAEFRPGQIDMVHCNLSDQWSVEAAFAATQKAFPEIDGIVNNAATVRRSDALDISWADWEETMAVNVYGAYEAARLLARALVARKSAGAIVNVASEAGKKGHTASVTYAASKAAMISMTRVMSAALAPYDINVNCVCPGGVATDMLRAAAANYARLSNGDQEQIFPKLTSSQLKRHIMPEEVARAISFLLSDDALVIRGQAINTDGGDTPY